MMLDGGDSNHPFRPIGVFRERRSAIESDFTEEDVAFLKNIAASIENRTLRGRVADLIWVRVGRMAHQYAVLAMDSYLEIEITTDWWFREGHEILSRAQELCAKLRAPQYDRLREKLVEFAFSIKVDHGMAAPSVGDLLLKCGFSHRDERVTRLAEHLFELASAFTEQRNWHAARECLKSSARWFEFSGDQRRRFELAIMVAETWVTEWQDLRLSPETTPMLGPFYYEKAIQQHRKIPRVVREKHNIQDRIAELHAALIESQAVAMESMESTQSEPLDLTDEVAVARAHVADKGPNDALRALARIAPFLNRVKAYAEADAQLRSNPLQRLFTSTHLADDGRVVSKGSSGFNDPGSPEYEGERNHAIMRSYLMRIGLTAFALIAPALEVLQLEHRFRLADFYYIVSNSTIVPTDCLITYSKGLDAGYRNDFTAAIHILAPQIENLVRHHLKEQGVITTTIDEDGIQKEIGLSSLVVKPEVGTIFGEDLQLELRFLFCDPAGPNLRNAVAHGLLRDADSESANLIYAWWFCFRLVFLPYWGQMNQAGTSNQSGGRSSSGD